MNARILILACLLALFIAAPAHAADIILDGACTLHDAITAANTDAPAGHCPAGSGADTIRAVWETREIELLTSLPPITSPISIVMADPHFVYIRDPGRYCPLRPRAFYVASGGHLQLHRVIVTCRAADYGGVLLVRRGGRADLVNSKITRSTAACGSAIYNEGTVNLTGVQTIGISGEGNGTAIYNRGNLTLTSSWFTVSSTILNDGGNVSLIDTDLLSGIGGHPIIEGGTCAPLTGAAVPVPAPECKLEPQLQAGDRAIRGGGSYSNLRAEAGLSGDRVGRIEAGAVVDVIEGPVDADGYNWYRVTADGDLEGWVAEAPARSFNCAYYFVGFDGELPPAAPDPIPERQACDMAEPLAVGAWAVIAGKTNINYRAEPGLAGTRSGTLAPGTVLEVLDGPEEADGYDWWQVRNLVLGIEGWLAQGGVLSSGDCLRWLLPLATEDAMDDESEMDESGEDMMDEESAESEEAMDDSSDDSEESSE
ncbi:MAG: SH3 domain-containing protein [Chloroflexi bacterium]|nr:SH3 domain-containing protein [Chloroflexota bacterium]